MLTQNSKIAVLESKLSMYEELSREMLTRLESAVEKISEGNNNIAQILTKHDERIEQSMKTDTLIIKMIDELKIKNENDIKIIHDRIDKINIELKAFSKFRWQVGGVVAVLMASIAIINSFAPNILTNNTHPTKIERHNHN